MQALVRRIEPIAYALFAGGLVLYLGCWFYSSLRLQTLYSRVWSDPAQLDLARAALGDWSAPLDDVFIHFDFARSTARGFPFQWSEGNGYSSGGTSLLYPFVLSIGYWAGFRGLSLMVWAAMLALVCVFALLLASRRLAVNLPRWTSYLVPPLLLCTGVLNWSLFSGMEVALFLAIWAGTLLAWDDLLRTAELAPSDDTRTPRQLLGHAALLGVWGVFLVGTRPEAITTLGVFCALALWALWRRHGARSALACVVLAAAPGALVVVAHAIANHVFTGDSTAAGARVKLELHHPYLSLRQVVEAWFFHFKYQVLRVSEYHFSSGGHTGWIVWLFSAAALAFRSTRRYALLLWASALAWLALVSLNGQVRWQNERYSMPAVAWLLLAAALGLGAILTQVRARSPLRRAAIVVPALAAMAVFVWNEQPRLREQVWFFGRASRNILDQHVRVGLLLKHHFQPSPRRVLVGDAGAIPYASDLPALDIIGLGGYHRLPFARATQYGVAAGIELIERIPASDRPDVLAIYPSWWGVFPLWFGERIAGGEVAVRGNVICGGLSKVLYRANWQPLADSERVFSLRPGERVVDTLDLADVISEDEHGYTLSRRGVGFVDMKMLPHPEQPRRDLWDAGRIAAGGIDETFRLSGLRAGAPARLIFRVAPATPSAIHVTVNDAAPRELELTPADRWQELSLELPAASVTETLRVKLAVTRGERILYHVWALQPR